MWSLTRKLRLLCNLSYNWIRHLKDDYLLHKNELDSIDDPVLKNQRMTEIHVIEGVLKKHPDKWFVCLAYNSVGEPPEHDQTELLKEAAYA